MMMMHTAARLDHIVDAGLHLGQQAAVTNIGIVAGTILHAGCL